MACIKQLQLVSAITSNQILAPVRALLTERITQAIATESIASSLTLESC